jgi:uncharacterized protein YcbX
MTQPQVKSLTIYPVKSMKGIALDQAKLTPLGLANDRRWMVVRENGRFLTQRDNGRLALIHTALNDTGLVLSLPGMPDLAIGFDARAGAGLASDVWGDEVQGTDLGDEISAWLTEALRSAAPVRMIRMLEGFNRPQNHPDAFGAETTTVFADAAPYLVANHSSLAALNEELVRRGLDAVPMNRFRPNIVIEGLAAFDEHRVTSLSHPEWRLDLRGPCERCVVTTIDQDSGERNPDRQPFRTLAEFNPMPDKSPPAPAFAQYATLADGADGTISVGDTLEQVV